MTSNQDDFLARHRLFRAMVLMGGSLALRCGGEASSPNHGSGADAAAGGNASSGGSPTNGGSVGTGGSVATGGSVGTGGVTVITGGKANIDPGSFDCPPAQWDCTANLPSCNAEGYRLPTGCKCDPGRPRDASACAAGQVFVCREAEFTNDGQQLETPFGFECSCVAEQLDCGVLCNAVFSRSGACSERTTSGLREILCECAVILLR